VVHPLVVQPRTQPAADLHGSAHSSSRPLGRSPSTHPVPFIEASRFTFRGSPRGIKTPQ
jgi:hypothetical protein